MQKKLNQLLSFILIQILLWVPGLNQKSFAGSATDEFHRVCDKPLERLENSGGKGAGGDQLLSTCAQADLARQAKNLETVKSVVYLVAAATATASAIIQMTSHSTAITQAAVASGALATASSYTPCVATASTTAVTEQGLYLTAAAACAAVPVGTALCATAPVHYAGAVGAASEGAADALSAATAAKTASGALKIVAASESTVASLAKLCNITSIAATAAGVGTDIVGQKAMNDTREKYNQSKDSFNIASSFSSVASSLTPVLLGGGGVSAATTQAANATKAATTASTSAAANATTATAAATAAAGVSTTASTEASTAAAAVANAVSSAAQSVTSVATSVTAATEASTMAAQTVAASTKSTGCVLSALGSGVLGYQSVSQAEASKSSMESLTQTALGIKNASDGSVNNLAGNQTNLNQQTASNTNSGGSHPPKSTDSKDPCSKDAGDQFLNCVGNLSPEFAAITNSPEFVSAMSTSLHGKNLGDFAKNYKGNSDSDLANYVAGGLGMSPSMVAAVIKNNEKMAKETGLDKFKPMAYARTAGSAPRVSNDLDFGKIMSGMMSKLDPNAGKATKADPSELVFRQLELLPAEKIQENKDISLFARIAFRYRKNADNVESLNSVSTNK